MDEIDPKLNVLKRLLGSGDPLPAALTEFVAQDAGAKDVMNGFARLDALLGSEPEPPEIDITQHVMAKVTQRERAGWATWIALAASVALTVGLVATFFAPTPLDSLSQLIDNPSAVETSYSRPELPLTPILETPTAWAEGVLSEVRASVTSEALPQAPLALILLLAPLLGVLNWYVSRKGQAVGGIA